MLLNSIPFFLFFSFFFLLYWLIAPRSLKLRNLFLLFGSYIFYASWDWRFLSLLIGSSLLNYILGISIYKTTSTKLKKLFLGLGLLQGTGMLIFFKYLNFFIESFMNMSARFGLSVGFHTLHIILPLGISFYTFRTISYLLDINKGKIEPVKDWCVFFNYVSFFPSIISGPIDRASLLVPQLETKQQFNSSSAADGLRQVLWGVFKKMVIANNCALLVNEVFENYSFLPASSLVLGAVFYTIQIYADFSGYSDMAIGLARLLGFNITRNFDYPFFSQNIADFWRRWHISLTSWLTEYVFTPLSILFRDHGKKGLILAILINFTLIGIWHGAKWTFVLFGFLHGCFYIPLIVKGQLNQRKKIPSGAFIPRFTEVKNMTLTFLLVSFAFVLFRSDSIRHAFLYYKNSFSLSLFSKPAISSYKNLAVIVFFSLVMLIVEWFQRDKQHGLQFLETSGFTLANTMFSSKIFRWAIYLLLIFCIVCFEGKEQDFIYIKF